MFKKCLILFTVTSLAGCANNIAANRISAESYSNDQDKSSYSRVFAWDSKYSAGIGNSNGLCAQGALTAEASSVGAALEAAAKQVDVVAKGGFEAAEAVSAINTSNAQTAFANIGYFYVCQIALNSQSANARGAPLTPDQVVDLFQSVSDVIPKVTSGTGEIASARSQQLEAFKEYLKNTGQPIPNDIDDQIEALEK